MQLYIENGVLKKIGHYGEVITRLEIPEGVTVVGEDTMFGGVCSGMNDLETVVIPKGVTKISAGAFRNCVNLREINFPEGLVEIGREAFVGCRTLTNIQLPETLRVIGARAFCGCRSLTQVTLPDQVVKIGGGGGYVSGVFSGCTGLKSVTLGKSIRYIPEYMFLDCTELTDVEVLGSLEKVEKEAFGGCKALKQLPLSENATVKEGAFWGCDAMVDEAGMLIIQNTLHHYCGQEGTVTIPDCVQKIGCKAFYQNETVTTVSASEGLRTVGREAFSGCKNLQKVYLPDTAVQLEDRVFSECTSLAQIRLSEGMKELPWGLFWGCKTLSQIDLPDSLMKIKGGGFSGCSKLAFIRIPDSVKSLEGEIANTTVFVPETTFEDYQQMRNSMFWGKGSAIYTRNGENSVRILLNDKFGKFIFSNGQQFSWQVYDAVLESNDAKLPAALQAVAMLYRLKFPEELTEERRKAFIAVVCKQVKKVAPYVGVYPEDDLVALLEQIGAVIGSTKKSFMVLAGLAQEEAKQKKTPAAKKKAGPVQEKGKTLSQFKKEWSFTKLEDGTLQLNSYKGTDIHVDVPEIIGTERVSTIGDECFSASWHSKTRYEIIERRRKIISVTIPEGVKSIGFRAFDECQSLETVKIPESMREIKSAAFRDCEKLKTLNLSQNVTVASEALRGCRAMADKDGFVIHGGVLHSYVGDAEEVKMPEGIICIARNAVYDRRKLLHMTLADTVETLEYACFSRCDRLKTVTFPAQTQFISINAIECYGFTVRGYTGSAAEFYAAKANKKFEPIGVLEKKEEELYDFEIMPGGILVKYNGNEKEVRIPDEVKEIRNPPADSFKGAFEGNKTVERVIIPDGVRIIGWNAFRSCSALKEIEIPNTIVDVGTGAFDGTPWLEETSEELIYAGQVLLRYREPETAVPGELREIKVREGTKVIGARAFGSTRSKLRVILPLGLENIGNHAFRDCTGLTELVVPPGVREPDDSAFWGVSNLKRCSGGVLHKTGKMSSAYKHFYTGEPDDTAWLQLYQTEDVWKKAIRKQMEQKPEIAGPALRHMAKMIRDSEVPDKSLGNRAAAFALEYARLVEKEVLQEILDVLKEKKLSAAGKKLEQDSVLVEMLHQKEEKLSELHPVEAEIFSKFKHTPGFEKVLAHIPEGIPYAGETTVCAPRVVAFVINEYVRQWDTGTVEKVDLADAAAEKLNQAKLLKLLEELTVRYGGMYGLPFARFADEKYTAELLKLMREWENWGKYGMAGRNNIGIAHKGLLLNDTRVAAMYFDKKGQLDRYAALRGMDGQMYRDMVLSEFGFDTNREIRYDLGGNTITAKLEKNLQLSLYDANAGKIVKSLPKKNADETLWEKAKQEIGEMRKSIKKVLTNRKDLLFSQFLTGERREASLWKRSYLENPVLKSMAMLLVWDQSGRTFVLTDTGAMTSDGVEYLIDDGEIALAHPMDMAQSDLVAWQKYFTANGIKQPFEQIWEPMVDPAAVKEDRYKDCMIPYYRFTGQKKHGIHVEDTEFHNNIEIYFDDCEADVERIDWLRHMIEMDHRFEIQNISFEKYTRKVNHIIAYLDRVTVVERIKKDDVSIAAMLPGFTLAQIIEFIQVASENNCTNVMAVLLDYKNRNFADFDPMEEFYLDL